MHTGNGHTDGMRVLIVEDDTQVRTALARALNFEGYEVETAADGAEGLEKVLTGAPDAIVLDVMMPHVDGLEATRRLRARGDATPVLMLTARHEVSDRVAGLDAGADDYLVKPFALEELLARLRALLRRAEPETSEIMRVGDLTLDPATREVRRDGVQIDLTKTEFQLLELLMFNEGIVLTRETSYERIWGCDFGTSSNSLDVYIGSLRRKTEPDDKPRLIQTIRGVGYVIRES